jgi:hypothetical protein
MADAKTSEMYAKRQPATWDHAILYAYRASNDEQLVMKRLCWGGGGEAKVCFMDTTQEP